MGGKAYLYGIWSVLDGCPVRNLNNLGSDNCDIGCQHDWVNRHTDHMLLQDWIDNRSPGMFL